MHQDLVQPWQQRRVLVVSSLTLLFRRAVNVCPQPSSIYHIRRQAPHGVHIATHSESPPPCHSQVVVAQAQAHARIRDSVQAWLETAASVINSPEEAFLTQEDSTLLIQASDAEASWQSLPEDVRRCVVALLPTPAVLMFGMVCREWRDLRRACTVAARLQKPLLHLLRSTLPALQSLDLSGDRRILDSNGALSWSPALRPRPPVLRQPRLIIDEFYDNRPITVRGSSCIDA